LLSIEPIILLTDDVWNHTQRDIILTENNSGYLLRSKTLSPVQNPFCYRNEYSGLETAVAASCRRCSDISDYIVCRGVAVCSCYVHWVDCRVARGQSFLYYQSDLHIFTEWLLPVFQQRLALVRFSSPGCTSPSPRHPHRTLLLYFTHASEMLPSAFVNSISTSVSYSWISLLFHSLVFITEEFLRKVFTTQLKRNLTN
jgi:hypothetical protein